MAKGEYGKYSDAYLREYPMPEYDASTVERLTKILKLVGGVSMPGHKWAHCARILFLQGHLKLESVDDRRVGSYNDPRQIDLEDSESISTYDELASVYIDPDGMLQIQIDESLRSLHSTPSCSRARFNLTGDWWRLWSYSRTVADRLEEKFVFKAEALRVIEEEELNTVRRNEIMIAMLNDNYPEGEDE